MSQNKKRKKEMLHQVRGRKMLHQDRGVEKEKIEPGLESQTDCKSVRKI